MRTRNAAALSAAAAITAAVFAAPSARALPPPAPPEAARPPVESAVWVSKELTFVYREFTTQYSCDGLQDRVKRVLLELGARSDLEVRGYGCTRLVGPDPFAGVRIKVNVLQPAAGRAGSGRTVRAHWQTVDLLAEHDPIWQAADCELVEQIRQQILPLFATRSVDYHATCEPRRLVPGSTHLTAQVLIADRSDPGEAVGR